MTIDAARDNGAIMKRISRQRLAAIVPDRRFVATIVRADGARMTTIVYGLSAGEAENRYAREHPSDRAIVRAEDRS